MARRLSHEDDPSPLLSTGEDTSPRSAPSFRPSFSASFTKMWDERTGSRMTLPTFIKQIHHNPGSSIRWGLISASLVSMTLLVSYMISLSSAHNSNNMNSSLFEFTGSAKWPNCPVPAQAEDICLHVGANLAELARVCGTLDASVGHCQDRFYGLIVAPGQALDAMSQHTYQLVLEGTDLGTGLDSFVQKNSRRMIDNFGAEGYERLATYDDQDRADLQHDLDQLQNRCERFFSGAFNPAAGFGSRWHLLELGLAVGLRYNMTLLSPGQPKNLINMTTCTTAQMGKAFAEHPPETNYRLWNKSTINYKSPALDIWDLLADRGMIEKKYEFKGHFWWRSMLMYYVTRPDAQMRQVIREAPKFPTPCIGIHVRHSDKVKETDLLDLSVYMKKAKEFKGRTGVSNVYLMTDDDAVIKATQNYPDFQFHYRDVPRSNKGWADDVKSGYTVEDQETDFLLDIYNIVQCQKLVVTYSSNVGRLIGELSHSIHNREPDVDTLNGYWGMNP